MTGLTSFTSAERTTPSFQEPAILACGRDRQESQYPITTPIHPAAHFFVLSSMLCAKIAFGDVSIAMPKKSTMTLTQICISSLTFCWGVTRGAGWFRFGTVGAAPTLYPFRTRQASSTLCPKKGAKRSPSLRRS